jgi:predicted transcriptional regulator
MLDGDNTVLSGKELQVSLTSEEYARLQSLAAKRDCSVEDLVRQAIRQVYMNDLEQDLTRLDVQRLEETPLLMDEEEDAIGIRGATIQSDKEGRIP